MGDAACVAPCSYEFPEGANLEEEEMAAPTLGGSITFGRYMSESLEWGKWSSFHQNRHLEEARKCSKPGSVAQRKAFFEKHYKRKAEALLEQQEANSATNSSRPAGEAVGNEDLQYAQPQLGSVSPPQSSAEAAADVAVQPARAPDTDASVALHPRNSSCANECSSGEMMMMKQEHHTAQVQIVEGVPPARTPLTSVLEKETCDRLKLEERYADLENQAFRMASPRASGDVEHQVAGNAAKPSRADEVVKPPLQESSINNCEVSTSKEKKRKPFLSSKCPIFNRASSSAAKAGAAGYQRKGIVTTNKSCNMYDKKISPPMSLHVSINLSAHKTDVAMPPTTKSIPIAEEFQQDSNPETPPLVVTSTKASATDLAKPAFSTPKSVTRSAKNNNTSGATNPKARRTNAASQSVSTDCWRSPSCTWKRPSQITCSPFSFKCDERAEKRREFFLKLEEKLNAEKSQRQAKAKEMAENELKRMRQGLGFKARPMPDFYRKTQPQKNEIKKIPPIVAQAPRLGKRVNPVEVATANSLPSSLRQQPLRKTERSTGKQIDSPTLAPPEKEMNNNNIHSRPSSSRCLAAIR